MKLLFQEYVEMGYNVDIKKKNEVIIQEMFDDI